MRINLCKRERIKKVPNFGPWIIGHERGPWVLLVCGITTTLVNGATIFFVGAWDYHVFCLVRVVATAFVGV
jgi:hypothetical protein